MVAMLATHYARFSIAQDALGSVADEYLDWILGEGSYANVRTRRIQTGIVASWRREDLAAGCDLEGEKSLHLAVRRHDHELRLHFVHGDAREPRRWHTAARIEAFPGGIGIEHAVAQAFDGTQAPRPVAAPPQVLRRVVDRFANAIEPRDLGRRGVTRVAIDEAETFVRHVVLDPNRALPIVVVSADETSGRPLLDVQRLASSLETLATVVEIDRDASFAWTKAFVACNHEQVLGRCFDGAIRLYRAPIVRGHDGALHYLWHPDRVAQWLESRRGDSQRATMDGAAEIAQQIVRRTLPPGFFRLIEAFDRERSAERARAVLARREVITVVVRKPAPQDSAEVIELRAQLDSARAEITALRDSLAETRSECDDYVAQIDVLEADLSRERQAVSELEQTRDGLRGDLSRLQRSGPSGPNEKITEAARAAFCRRDPTLEQALLVLGWLAPDRVRVLPTALTSARRSSDFLKREKAWDLLWRLATSYWEAMCEGRGDAAARHVFTPNEYSAQESETTKSNRVGRERRTFDVDGEPVTMWRHLKIGVKEDSFTETWRCHFEWVGKDRTVVIGHCGAHLDQE